MEEFRKFLTIENRVYSIKILFLLIFVAYIFSIAVRWIWVGYAEGIPQFMWNGQIMINTNDGYAWAEGARDILSGTHQANDGSFVDWAPSQLTAFFAQTIPVRFETLILYLPAFLGSLLVIPLILIGRLFKNDLLGFIAALFAGITWSYYNRTMIGYYDTDMLTIVFPTFLLWSILAFIKTKQEVYLLSSALLAIASQWWYAQSYSLTIAMVVMVFLYSIIWDRKSLLNYKLIIFILIGLLKLPFIINVLIAAGLFSLFYKLQEKANKIIFPILLLLLAFIFITGGLTPILYQIKGYLFRDIMTSDVSSFSLHYFNVLQTVREASNIPFETFANRISGHTVIFIISTIGYVLLSLRYKNMWLALPMIGLGFLALKGGLRFTIYAVPINALGLPFFILLVTHYIKERFFKYSMAVLMISVVLYFNIKHIEAYKVPTVFNNNDVETLSKLKTIADREDYVISWWDYGYPIRYYADVKTLIDGARHSGEANYPVSFALLHDSISAANLSRTYTEYLEQSYTRERNISGIKAIMKDYDFKRVSSFLSALKSKKFNVPTKTRDIYFYLPFKMMNILPTIDLFSNMNLETGKQYKQGMFYRGQAIEKKNGIITLDNGIKIQNGVLHLGLKKLPINQFIVTQYNKNGVLTKQIQHFNIGSPYYVIYMSNYNQFLILDKRLFNSSYIQLYVLENYDPELFEPTILTPMLKIYKLKR